MKSCQILGALVSRLGEARAAQKLEALVPHTSLSSVSHPPSPPIQTLVIAILFW